MKIDLGAAYLSVAKIFIQIHKFLCQNIQKLKKH